MGIIVPLVSASGCCCNGVYDNLCALERGSGRLQSLIITHSLPMECNGIIICNSLVPRTRLQESRFFSSLILFVVLKTGEDCFFCFSGGNGLSLYNLSSTTWRQCFAPEQVLMFFYFS